MARNDFRGVSAAIACIRNAAVSVVRVLFRSLFLVRGDSMCPMLRDGDLVCVRPASAEGRSYRRGSVVVAEISLLEGESALATSIKRVIGLPGELVRVSGDGAVWIEGATLAEPYLAPAARAAPGPDLSWLCDDDEYFLLGDNRADSMDSRRFGPVPASAVIGGMWFRLPTHGLFGRRPSNRADLAG